MKIIGNLILAAVVLLVISFFVAPGVAFFGLRSAADSGDVAELDRLVDYGAMRKALGPQLTGRVETLTPPPSILEDPIGAVQRQFQRGPVAEGPRADAYLTPAALGALTRGEGRAAALRSEAGNADAEPPSGGPFPRPVYWGMDRARMAVTGDSGGETVFTFARTGFFSWHLVHVSLPEDRGPHVGKSGAHGG
ncbi:MAG: DUF2939 domain-containing protein [Brevundimonas sp.]|nr:DUF2939 domain-containing protein [Brevundimonas sp.]